MLTAGNRVWWTHRRAGVYGSETVIKIEACEAEVMPSVTVVDGVAALGEPELVQPRIGTVTGPDGPYFAVQFDGYALTLTSDELVRVEG